MAQYTEDTTQVIDSLKSSDLSPDTISSIENLLNSQPGDTTTIQVFDGTPPDEGTTILIVGPGQSLTFDPGTAIIIMDPNAGPAQVTLDTGDGQDRVFIGGGGDDNIQVTGDGNSTIETGGGNDTVTGGNGDDTVIITGSGSSSVATGEGDDTIIVTGDGTHTVNAGDGNDTIILGTDQGEITVDGGDGFDQIALDDSSGNHTFTIVDGILVMNSARTEITNVEAVQFQDGVSVIAENATEGAIARMYEVMFDRQADLGGLAYWFGRAEEGVSAGEIANGMASSQEFTNTYGDLSNADLLDSYYQNAFGRQADAGGKAYWLDQMSAGLTDAQVAESFATSQEAVQLMGIDGTQYVIDIFSSQ
jgi:hypothetical protein